MATSIAVTQGGVGVDVSIPSVFYLISGTPGLPAPGPVTIYTTDGVVRCDQDMLTVANLISVADATVTFDFLQLPDGRSLVWCQGYLIAAAVVEVTATQSRVDLAESSGTGDALVLADVATAGAVVFVGPTGGGGGGGAPPSNVAPAVVDAGASSPGVALEYSRGDHKHTAATAAPVSIGSVNAPGVLDTLSRSDHVHDGSGLLTGALPTTIRSGDAAAPGIALTAARADHTHAVLVPVTPADVDAGPPHQGFNTTPARDDHRHSAVVGPPVSVGFSNLTGVLESLSRSDHVHDGSAVIAAALSNAAPTVIEAGDAGVPGVATLASRADHQHAFPASVLAPVPVDAGAPVVGVSVVTSREDHKHSIDTATAVSIGTANAPGVAVTLSRSDHVHSGLPLLTAAAPSQVDIADAATVGVATTAARADHQHAFPAGGAPVNVNAAAAAAGAATTAARSDHKHSIDTAAPVSVGVANAPGVSTSLARADHVHDASAILSPGGAPTGIVIGQAASVGASATAARSDHQHPYSAPSIVSISNNLATALGAAETVIFNQPINVPAASAPGRLFIAGETAFAFSALAAGVNGAELRLYVDGVLFDSKRYEITVAGIVGATVQHNAVPVSIAGPAFGIAAGAHTIELRAIKTGAIGTAALSGFQKLAAFPI